MRKTLMCLITVFLLIFLYFVSFVANVADMPEDVPEDVPDEAECIAEVPDSEEYTVREYGGKVGIFKPGSSLPEYVINVFTFTLPETDRAMIASGFTVGKDMIVGVIEDYSS